MVTNNLFQAPKGGTVIQREETKGGEPVRKKWALTLIQPFTILNGFKVFILIFGGSAFSSTKYPELGI